MFKKILHANDGSESAFQALSLAIALAKQNGAELHSVSVEELSYMPEYAEEVREEKANAGRRFRAVLQRARAMVRHSRFTWRRIFSRATRCATSSSWPPTSKRIW